MSVRDCAGPPRGGRQSPLSRLIASSTTSVAASRSLRLADWERCRSRAKAASIRSDDMSTPRACSIIARESIASVKPREGSNAAQWAQTLETTIDARATEHRPPPILLGVVDAHDAAL